MFLPGYLGIFGYIQTRWLLQMLAVKIDVEGDNGLFQSAPKLPGPRIHPAPPSPLPVSKAHILFAGHSCAVCFALLAGKLARPSFLPGAGVALAACPKFGLTQKVDFGHLLPKQRLGEKSKY